MANNIPITVMLKDGGFQQVKIPSNYIGPLALAIDRDGWDWLTLKSGPINVVGFLVTGKQTGERVIILGKDEGESDEC